MRAIAPAASAISRTRAARGCGATLVERRGYVVEANRVTSNGDCPACQAEVPGIWPSRHRALAPVVIVRCYPPLVCISRCGSRFSDVTRHKRAVGRPAAADPPRPDPLAPARSRRNPRQHLVVGRRHRAPARAGRCRWSRKDSGTTCRRPSAGCGRRSRRTARSSTRSSPTTCPCGSRNRAAGAQLLFTRAAPAPPNAARQRRQHVGAARRPAPAVHRVAPPTSMYSMKRISAPSRAASCTSDSTSSSLTPRMTTVSILNPGKTRAAARGLRGHAAVRRTGSAP